MKIEVKPCAKTGGSRAAPTKNLIPAVWMRCEPIGEFLARPPRIRRGASRRARLCAPIIFHTSAYADHSDLESVGPASRRSFRAQRGSSTKPEMMPRASTRAEMTLRIGRRAVGRHWQADRSIRRKTGKFQSQSARPSNRLIPETSLSAGGGRRLVGLRAVCLCAHGDTLSSCAIFPNDRSGFCQICSWLNCSALCPNPLRAKLFSWKRSAHYFDPLCLLRPRGHFRDQAQSSIQPPRHEGTKNTDAFPRAARGNAYSSYLSVFIFLGVFVFSLFWQRQTVGKSASQKNDRNGPIRQIRQRFEGVYFLSH